MATTWSGLLDKIARRINRDDLAIAIREIAEERVHYYQREVFYSARFSDNSITTTAGEAWYDFPSGWDNIHQVRLLQGTSIWLTLERLSYEELQSMDTLNPSIRSIPAYWTTFGSPMNPGTMAIRLFPAPGTSYELELTMDKPPDVPADDASNFWTTDGEVLIMSATIAGICAQHINDPVRQKTSSEIENAEAASLMSRSIRSRGGIRVRSYW